MTLIHWILIIAGSGILGLVWHFAEEYIIVKHKTNNDLTKDLTMKLGSDIMCGVCFEDFPYEIIEPVYMDLAPEVLDQLNRIEEKLDKWITIMSGPKTRVKGRAKKREKAIRRKCLLEDDKVEENV